MHTIHKSNNNRQAGFFMTDKIANIFDEIPNALPAELFETLLENQNVKLERIVSHGHITPENEWYNQAQDEWVILLKGRARIALSDGRETSLKTGDHLLIPAHAAHRVSWTDPKEHCVWLALHVSNTAE